MASYGIIFPVYNEEKRILKGIQEAYQYISSLGIVFEFLIVDNGSTDRTEELARQLCKRLENVNYLRIKEKGVGVAFKSGVKRLKTDIVGYMDIDLSTDIRYFSRVTKLFEDDDSIDLINGSRFNKKSITTGRKWYRNITSYGLVFLLKIVFAMKATDAICGFKFFKQTAAMALVSEASEETGWFLIIELLLRAERKGMKVVELPVRWEDDIKNSKVDVIDTISNYIIQIIKLKKALKNEKDVKV